MYVCMFVCLLRCIVSFSADRIADSTLHTADSLKEAESKVADMKASNPLFASLFNSSRPEITGDAARKNLFIRTSTAIYTQNR